MNAGDSEAGETDTEDSNECELDLPASVAHRCMQCMAHTLQLTIIKSTSTLIHWLIKARSTVGHIRKTSKIMEWIICDTNKGVVTENA